MNVESLQCAAAGGDLVQEPTCSRTSPSNIPNATKTKASPGGEAFQDKAAGGDLLQIATGGGRSNSAKRKTPTVSGEGVSG